MYSVLVVTLQTEREKELTKEYKDDTQKILAELHNYHTKSEMAQHEIAKLTTYITNLRLTNMWKWMTQQFIMYLRNYVDWKAWGKNLMKSPRLHASFFSNKQSIPFMTFNRFTSWTLLASKNGFF